MEQCYLRRRGSAEPDCCALIYSVRSLCLLVFVVLAGCGPSAPVESPRHDPTTESWYAKDVNELTAMNRQAEEFFRKGKGDEAAALIEKGEPISQRLIGVLKPTLAATEAASDLDQLYGEMLFSNHNYGWARLLFQRNVARWKNWKPQTADSDRRLKLAESAIAECDRKIDQ